MPCTSRSRRGRPAAAWRSPPGTSRRGRRGRWCLGPRAARTGVRQRGPPPRRRRRQPSTRRGGAAAPPAAQRSRPPCDGRAAGPGRAVAWSPCLGRESGVASGALTRVVLAPSGGSPDVHGAMSLSADRVTWRTPKSPPPLPTRGCSWVGAPGGPTCYALSVDPSGSYWNGTNRGRAGPRSPSPVGEPPPRVGGQPPCVPVMPPVPATGARSALARSARVRSAGAARRRARTCR